MCVCGVHLLSALCRQKGLVVSIPTVRVVAAFAITSQRLTHYKIPLRSLADGVVLGNPRWWISGTGSTGMGFCSGQEVALDCKQSPLSPPGRGELPFPGMGRAFPAYPLKIQ